MITPELTPLLDTPGYKERSVRTKFLQQLFLGVGGATVFGLVGALALGSASVTLLSGIIIAAIGVGCIFMGSKYLADSVQMDQENQARKIGMLSQSPAVVQTIATQPETPAPRTAPLSVSASQEEMPATQWAEKFTKNNQVADWVSKTTATAPLETARA